MQIITEILLPDGALGKFEPVHKSNKVIALINTENSRRYKLQQELVCGTLPVEYYAVNRFFKGDSKLVESDTLLVPNKNSLHYVNQIRYPFIDIISNFSTGDSEISFFENSNMVIIGEKKYKIRLAAIDVTNNEGKINYIGNFEELFCNKGSSVNIKTSVKTRHPWQSNNL